MTSGQHYGMSATCQQHFQLRKIILDVRKFKSMNQKVTPQLPTGVMVLSEGHSLDHFFSHLDYKQRDSDENTRDIIHQLQMTQHCLYHEL